MKKQIEILLVMILCFGWCGLAEAEITVKDWQFLYKQAEKKAESYYDYIRITRSIADGENTLQRSNGFLMIIKFKTWCLIFQQL